MSAFLFSPTEACGGLFMSITRNSYALDLQRSNDPERNFPGLPSFSTRRISEKDRPSVARTHAGVTEINGDPEFRR